MSRAPTNDKKTARKHTMDDNKVGYGNPPKANRFKPGQSGNPRGRPPAGAVPPGGLAEHFLNEEITIIENGKRIRLTTRAAIMKKVRQLALAGGNPRLINRLFDMLLALDKQDAWKSRPLRRIDVEWHDARDGRSFGTPIKGPSFFVR